MWSRLLVLTLLLGACTDVAAPVYTARPIGVSVSPGQLVADVDRDGRLDRVGVAPGTLSVRTLIDGRFAASTVFTLPDVAAGLALGDVDGDGRQDIITALPQRASVLWSSGAALGRSRREVEIDAAAASVVAGDVDGDGFTDVVATVPDEGLVLLRGGPDGPRMSQRLMLGDVAAVALIDRGGRSDVAVSLPDRGVVQLFTSNAGARLEVAEVAWQTVVPGALVAGDLDGDGTLDLAAADPLARRVWVGLGDGDGGWRTRNVYALEVEPARLLARRGPAGPELVIAGADGRSLLLFDARSGALRASAATRGPQSWLVVADLEGDGVDELLHDDAVLRDTIGDSLRSSGPVGPATGPLLRVDLDGDGRDELVVEEPARAELVVYAVDGAALDEQRRVPLPTPLVGLGAVARGDGGHDLTWWGATTFGLLIGEELEPVTSIGAIAALIPFRFDGAASEQLIARTQDFASDPGASMINFRDELFVVVRAGGLLAFSVSLFAGDGVVSVVPAQLDDDAADELWIAHAGGVTAIGGEHGPQVAAGAVRDLAGATAVDLDGDGALDLVGCDPRGARGVLAAHGLGDGGLGPVERLAEIRCTQVHACPREGAAPLLALEYTRLPGDDATLELLHATGAGWASGGGLYLGLAAERLAVGCEDGDLSVWTGGARGLTSHRRVAGPALVEQGATRGGARALLGDLDGDGLDEFIADDGAQVLLTRADGAGEFVAPVALKRPSPTWRLFELGEFDGAPGAELIGAERDLDGVTTHSLWSLRDDRLVRGPALAAPFWEAIADFDGDGRDELLTRANGLPALIRPDAAPTLLTHGTLAGKSTLRAADLDGDGRSDLLTSEPSKTLGLNELHLLRSEGGGFAAGRSLGRASDRSFVTIGDLDHDASLDLVVVDPDGQLRVCLRGEAGPAADCHTHAVPGLPARVRNAAIEDLDGDHQRDLVLGWLDGDESSFQVFHGDGAGGLVPAPAQPLVDGALQQARLGGERPAWVLRGLFQPYLLQRPEAAR